MQIKSARLEALQLLHQVLNEGKYSNKLIQAGIDQSTMSELDKRFIRNLVYGVIEHSLTLEYWLAQLSTVKINKIEKKTLIILKMALYQIAYMDKVPNSAAVDEAVKMTKKINFKSSGFVNGILRSFLRLEGKWPTPDPKKDFPKYLSIQYSHPEWLVNRWLKTFGNEQTEALLAADNEVPKISIRVNTLKTDLTTLESQLKASGFETHRHEIMPDALIIEQMGNTPLHRLEAFEKGLFFVQDLAAMLVGHVTEPKPGDVILDLCAAPGGKTTHLAQLMNDQGVVVARDVSEFKVNLVRENVERLGIKCVHLEVKDALIFNENEIEKYDKIILDAPCSGLGIIRRKPEIRYNRTADDIEALSRIQKEMITVASKYLKKGGELIYSTCTIEPCENEEVVEWFLSNNPNFTMAELPQNLQKLSEDGKSLKLYQSVLGYDGFYIVKLNHSK